MYLKAKKPDGLWLSRNDAIRSCRFQKTFTSKSISYWIWMLQFQSPQLCEPSMHSRTGLCSSERGSQRRQTVICSIYHRQTHILILLTGLIVLKLLCIQSQMDRRVFLCCNSTKKNCNSQHSCGRSIHLTKKKLQFLRFLWSIYLSHKEKTAILEILVVDLFVSEERTAILEILLVSDPSRRMGFV